VSATESSFFSGIFWDLCLRPNRSFFQTYLGIRAFGRIFFVMFFGFFILDILLIIIIFL